MWNRRQQTEAALVHHERRQREDEAPRLRQEVRQLAALDIEIDEFRAAGTVLAARHTRRIVVEQAPAHFEIPCSEERCTGGGYDLTYEVMRALEARRTLFDGQAACPGSVGSAECGRTLRYVAHASYIEDAPVLGRARASDRRP
ncbi:MAG: hypothetical protein JW940_25165 [Polyangiaceae bacterium]|nr:hypothetical protein [Polyangiaceae bacterium]